MDGPLEHLGAMLQASRVKFVFEDDTLEVVLGEQQAETENAFVGGENKWAFSSFTNWEYWFPGFPILVYFKARLCACTAAACSALCAGFDHHAPGIVLCLSACCCG